MPIYEYRCEACSKVFEELVLRCSDEAELACPACGDETVNRLMSAPARSGGSDGAPAPGGRCGPVG